MEEKLNKLKALFIDADGVLFDGTETRSAVGGNIALAKNRSLIDGQGISFLRELGIRVVFVSGEGEALQSILDKVNNLPSAVSGRWSPVEFAPAASTKSERAGAWAAANVPLADCAYFGDDIDDYAAMAAIQEKGGMAIAPQNATRRIKQVADLVTNASGGNGAIREFTELVLDARGVDESTLPPA